MLSLFSTVLFISLRETHGVDQEDVVTTSSKHDHVRVSAKTRRVPQPACEVGEKTLTVLKALKVIQKTASDLFYY